MTHTQSEYINEQRRLWLIFVYIWKKIFVADWFTSVYMLLIRQLQGMSEYLKTRLEIS